MRNDFYQDTPEAMSPAVNEYGPEDYIWSTSEKSRLRSLSLFLIQSIVDSYGGTVDIDLATNTVNIDVPEEHRTACAQAIEEQVGNMYV